ncbi:MAG: deoxyguanosine kinase [Micavibrio sp.]|nr:MAG: deoxyguanosine kinase [Micavibrio sp.]
MNKPLRLAIEGNIGVGKSTLLKTLPLELGENWYPLPERADEDPEFKRLLNEFYADPNKRVDLQAWITNSRIAECKTLRDDSHYIFERSFIGDMIFCHANFMRHERPSGELLGFYYDIMQAARDWPLDGVIYLKAAPQTCYDRILSRSRNAEDGIPMEYIRYLHNCYETHLPEIAENLGIPVITINWEAFQTTDFVAEKLEKFLQSDIYDTTIRKTA